MIILQQFKLDNFGCVQRIESNFSVCIYRYSCLELVPGNNDSITVGLSWLNYVLKINITTVHCFFNRKRNKIVEICVKNSEGDLKLRHAGFGALRPQSCTLVTLLYCFLQRQ